MKLRGMILYAAFTKAVEQLEEESYFFDADMLIAMYQMLKLDFQKGMVKSYNDVVGLLRSYAVIEVMA